MAPSSCSWAQLDDGPAVVQPAAGDARRTGPCARRCATSSALPARLIREEVFPAEPGHAQCRDCPFVPICPAKSAGSVLSQMTTTPAPADRGSTPRGPAGGDATPTGRPATSSGRRSRRRSTPSVVIAGAGSGKTTLMAARVVYLVVTGQVRPDEVLGLTFTTKAASRAAPADPRRTAGRRGARASARRHGRATTSRGRARARPWSTYNAYAADLLTEHGLRIGHEPDTRVITDASRYQLGARAVERLHRRGRAAQRPPADRDPEPARPRRRDERAPRRRPSRCGRRRRGAARVRGGAGGGARGQGPQDLPRGHREGDLGRRPARASCSSWSRPTGGSRPTSA